jgi:hypothetical protein
VRAIKVLMAGAALALPAFAHHSFAMFDTDKPITLTGSVREFQWTNPHCFIQLLMMGRDSAHATQDEWSIEMVSPGQLIRAGWKPATLKQGDKLTVVIFPLRDGGKGGAYVSATGPNGKLGGTRR